MKAASQQSVTTPHALHFPSYILALLLITGCASARFVEEPPINLAWPTPPDKARIRFIRSVSKTSDITRNTEAGWIKKIWSFLAGEAADQLLIAPYGVTADDQGNVYVADRDTREVFSFNLLTRKSHALYFEADDPEDHPIGIGIARNVYISYPNSNRVVVLNKKGDVLSEIGKGVDFQRPTGVAVNQDKNLLYVADTLAHDIKVFDLSGKQLFTFGKRGGRDGEFNFPTHIFIARDGTVYVTDELNFRIQAFTHDGNFLFKFGKLGIVPGTFQSPKGVAVDSDGNIYVADAMADSIQIFNNEGRLLLFFGGSGSGDGQFAGPAGMFIDKDDRVYITDLYNARVQVFQYLKGSE